MKFTFDSSVDAAYIRLAKDDDAVQFSFTYSCDPAEVSGDINLDFDINGRLIGIEILQATKKLPLSLLK